MVFILSFQRYEVSVSMMEIYNEQVRDLLTNDFPKGGKHSKYIFHRKNLV
jgi:hypothetical protein